MNYRVRENVGDKIDREALLLDLQRYYDTIDNTVILKKLRDDLKTKNGLRKLLAYTSVDIKALLAHLNVLFEGLFTKKLIKRVRENLKFML